MKLFNLAVIAALMSSVVNAQLILPNPTLTPGAVFTNLSPRTLCKVRYTASVRSVPSRVSKQVFSAYHVNPKSDKFEIDHLISLELGGTNEIKNLWPQSYTTHPDNAHIKDKLENELHRRICVDKTMTMAQAQKIISTDWIAGYKEYYCTNHKVKDDTCK